MASIKASGDWTSLGRARPNCHAASHVDQAVIRQVSKNATRLHAL
jgi:hypothetical protein